MPRPPHRKAPGLAGMLAFCRWGQHATRRQQERNESAASPLKSRELRGSVRGGCTFADKYRALWEQLKRGCASAEKLKYRRLTTRSLIIRGCIFSQVADLINIRIIPSGCVVITCTIALICSVIHTTF